MNDDNGVSRRERFCLVVTAVLPWYGVLTGTFVLFIFVLITAARLGGLVFGVVLLAVLLLLVSPTAFFIILCDEGRRSGAIVTVAQVGSAVTLVFSMLYSGISTLLALTAFGVVRWTEYDPEFGDLSTLNTAMLAFGFWCVVIALRALRRLG